MPLQYAVFVIFSVTKRLFPLTLFTFAVVEKGLDAADQNDGADASYRWKGKAERRRADKRAEYRLVAVIFGGLTAFFALETVHILTLSKIPFLLALCALGFDMVYAVADAVKSGKK